MMRRTTLSILASIAAVAGIAACSDEDRTASQEKENQKGASCDERPDPHCDHPIDRIVVEKLRTARLEPRDGAASSVCRRMAIDLIGRIPTNEELDRCMLQPSLGERADAFMAMPDYALTQQRAWGETLGYNTYLAWYGNTWDLDRITGELFTGAINYPTFVSNIVVHPGFYGLHQEEEWGSSVISIFLGRAARPDEIAGMRPLRNVFESRVFCDGAIWTAYHTMSLEDGRTPEEAKLDADEGCVGDGTEEHIINFCGCYVGEGSIGCRSSTLGTLIDFGTTGCADYEDFENPKNMFRFNTTHVPGTRTTCISTFDGSGPKVACQDRAVDEEEKVGGILTPIAAADDSVRDRLFAVGRALAAREDFWEAAVDRELGRFIGWWKDGVRRPDFDLPQVRSVLAAKLKEEGSLRNIQKLIVTSLLYAGEVEPPEIPEGEEAPLWSMGSTKALTSEAWLDSAAIATFGKVLGACDHRFLAIGDIGPTNADALLVRKLASPLASFDTERYYESAVVLGGCSAEQPRPRSSTVGIAYAQHDLARSLCAASPAILPNAFDGSSDEGLKIAARHVARRTLSRDLSDEAINELATDMKECMGAGAEVGCASPEAAVRWLCTRVIDSAEFALY